VIIVAVIGYYIVLQEIPAALQDHLEWGLMLFLIASSPINILHLDYFFSTHADRLSEAP